MTAGEHLLAKERLAMGGNGAGGCVEVRPAGPGAKRSQTSSRGCECELVLCIDEVFGGGRDGHGPARCRRGGGCGGRSGGSGGGELRRVVATLGALRQRRAPHASAQRRAPRSVPRRTLARCWPARIKAHSEDDAPRDAKSVRPEPRRRERNAQCHRSFGRLPSSPGDAVVVTARLQPTHVRPLIHPPRPSRGSIVRLCAGMATCASDNPS